MLGDNHDAAERFEEFANFEPCPALDPDRGTCNFRFATHYLPRLWAADTHGGRPGHLRTLLSRSYCNEIAGCEIKLDEAYALQAEMDAELQTAGKTGKTIVAFALIDPSGIGA